MSSNFLIKWLLITFLEQMCLNFRSILNAAVEERSVLKDWSIKVMASPSIACADACEIQIILNEVPYNYKRSITMILHTRLSK